MKKKRNTKGRNTCKWQTNLKKEDSTYRKKSLGKKQHAARSERINGKRPK